LLAQRPERFLAKKPVDRNWVHSRVWLRDKTSSWMPY
jgi:hypothetical protein